jgi:hypothetical protein
VAAAAVVEQLLAMALLPPAAVAAAAAAAVAAPVPQQRPVTELLAAVVPQVCPKRASLKRIKNCCFDTIKYFPNCAVCMLIIFIFHFTVSHGYTFYLLL